jgi:predicted dehydrogenase
MRQLALVGCGHIHTPGFIKRLNNRSDVQVKYTWDHDRGRAEKCAADLKASPVDDLTQVWNDSTVEAVIICSETNRHEALVLAAAAAKKHLFVEKPLGMDAADAYRMADAIDQAGVLFQTGYFRRGDPIHQFLREQIKAGNLGKITRFRHSDCHSGSLRGLFDTEWHWMADLAQAGVGGFGDLGTHSLDIMMWLMGDVERVTASIHVATGRYGECDEYGEGLLEFAGGGVGSLAAGWVDVTHPVSLILSGTEGHAYVANQKLYYKSNCVNGADGETPWTELPPAWPHAFELFLDAVNGQKDAPLVTAQEAATRSAVMGALYQAARQHSWEKPVKHA